MRHATSRLRRLTLASSAALVWLAAAVTAVEASPESRRLTQTAYDRAYDLRLHESLDLLSRARAVDPSDPAPPRAVAAVTWVTILCAQGVATFAAFEGTATRDVVARPAVPEVLRHRFTIHVEEAIALAERGRQLRPDDLDAQYQLGASLGLRALYRGTVEGRTFDSFTDGRKAVLLLDSVRRGAAQHHESALLPGIYRYAVSTLSFPKRLLAAAAGLGGDRDVGVALLETAAMDAAATASDASIVLMIVYNREGRHRDALRHLRLLHRRHPANRLLRLNLAATELAAGDGAAAVRTIGEGPTGLAEPEIPGERALWLYIRGAARVRVADPSAGADLQEALTASPREWVRARVHVELARLALASGSRVLAETELERAVHHARRAGDGTALAAARELWGLLVTTHLGTPSHEGEQSLAPSGGSG
jgi:tetratricopeptide (TPR) repeat protein